MQQYDFEEQIGFGSFSVVHRAINLETNERVAIKIVKPEKTTTENSFVTYDFEGVKREIKFWSGLDHPNLCKLYKVIEFEDGKEEEEEEKEDELALQVAFVMEYATGGDLLSYLSSPANKNLPSFVIKEYFRQLIEAVDHLHCAGLVHGDIKLENILLTDDKISSVSIPFNNDRYLFKRILLTDFGLTRPVSVTIPIKCGTIEYSAPELLLFNTENVNENENENISIDPIKADIWALGIVLYGMIFKRLPFDGSTPKSLKTRILTSQPKYNESDSKNEYYYLINLCKMLLKKNPSERMDLKEVLKYLENHCDGPSFQF